MSLVFIYESSGVAGLEKEPDEEDEEEEKERRSKTHETRFFSA